MVSFFGEEDALLFQCHAHKGHYSFLIVGYWFNAKVGADKKLILTTTKLDSPEIKTVVQLCETIADLTKDEVWERAREVTEHWQTYPWWKRLFPSLHF